MAGFIAVLGNAGRTGSNGRRSLLALGISPATDPGMTNRQYFLAVFKVGLIQLLWGLLLVLIIKLPRAPW
jgi:hypothetical protein